MRTDDIKSVVRDGHVTLKGEVEWDYQRRRAADTALRVSGVTGLTNEIEIKPKVKPEDLKRKIEDAFKRNAEVDAQHITVEAEGNKVVLRGTVRSWAEREEAERVAWLAPGVTRVDNRITIDYWRVAGDRAARLRTDVAEEQESTQHQKRETPSALLTAAYTARMTWVDDTALQLVAT